MKNIFQFLKFCFVGFINTSITFFSFSLLVYLDTNYLLANVVGYLLGMFSSFTLNSLWVFKGKKTNFSVLSKFVIGNIIILFLNTLFLYLLKNNLHINLYLAQIFVIGICLLLNFALSKFWTFNSPKEQMS
jgi:putative flippase GtrA